jgi:DNA-binding PadR family transcriptional regulator
MSKEGRRRKYYRLTEAGRQELEKHAKQWELVYSVLSSAIIAAKSRKDDEDV